VVALHREQRQAWQHAADEKVKVAEQEVSVLRKELGAARRRVQELSHLHAAETQNQQAGVAILRQVRRVCAKGSWVWVWVWVWVCVWKRGVGCPLTTPDPAWCCGCCGYVQPDGSRTRTVDRRAKSSACCASEQAPSALSGDFSVVKV